MPRRPRIDEPGLIHHVIARGIERRQIFNDDDDAVAFLARLARLTPDTGMHILAFALMPNHIHLLLQRSGTPVSTFMQRLLTGHAIYFNKRHDRTGHLFQNRYKSIMCRSDLHFLELIRYIHLNPLRSGLVKSLDELARFPFSGHRLLLQRRTEAWFDPMKVLVHFGSSKAEAQKEYLDFVAAGLSEEQDCVAQGCIEGPFDSEGELQKPVKRTWRPSGKKSEESLISDICLLYEIIPSELFKARTHHVSQARSLLAFRLSREMGLPGSEIGRRLSVSRSAASKMIVKGRELDSAHQSKMETLETYVPD